MENKIAVIATVVKDANAVDGVNALFHEFSSYIVGRMGLPLKERGISVINVVLDAPIEIINNLSGKLGMIENVSSKVLVTK
ncbi:MAG: iron-only hydrogenase system regulator [Clostridia bacterium]|nr:iron-only hydrogenase system regulator [Clostridia bacterium]